MKKTPVYLIAISIIGFVTAILGLVIAFKIPGNIAIVPLILGLLFALLSIIISRKNKYKCYGGYIGSTIALIGIVVVLVQQSKVPEIAEDREQTEQMEQSDSNIVESNQLNEALDD